MAEDLGLHLALEGHVLVTLQGQTTAALLNAVGSPRVRCSLDPVNWITLETVYDSGPAVARMVDVLGPLTVSAHAKDVVLEDRLVTHLTEADAGTGLLDYDTLLPCLEALSPDLPLIAEHCPTESLPAISAFLHRKAEALGIAIPD